MNRIFLLICTICIFTACQPQDANDSGQPGEQTQTNEPITLEGDDLVLATVNGTPITQYELNQTINTTLGKYSALNLDESGRKKVLESLVMSRAIALKQKEQMTSENEAVIEKLVQSYKEQLLVKQYLALNAKPEPVTREMVETYYKKHPEQYGGKTIRNYEMITSKRELKSEERDALIDVLGNASAQKNWKTMVEALQKKGYPIAYKQGNVNEKILHPKLKNLMQPLKKGMTSQLTFIKSRLYITRIAKETKINPRPLGEVSAQIRKTLLPIQLKKSIKKVSADILGEVAVEYK